MIGSGPPPRATWLGLGGFSDGTFVLMRGYIDESYNSKIFTLSCLMSPRWAFIESEWKKCLSHTNQVLRSKGRNEISRYHAADCSSCRGEFKGWEVEEQIALTKSLAAIFKRHFVNVIAYSMPLKDFVREFPEYRGDPIGPCYSELLKFMMLEFAAQLQDGRKALGNIKPVHVVLFHDRCNYDAVLLKSFNEMINATDFPEGKKIFSTIAPLSWEDCIPLQAADMIAYEAFKEAERKISGRRRRKSLEFILGMAQFGGRSKTFDPKSIHLLREAVDKISQPKNVQTG